jgi:uncharacterized protein (DUF952 family)
VGEQQATGVREHGSEPILHITSRTEWDAAPEAGEYTAPSLTEEGFIHCSTAPQVVDTAERYYRGRDDLVLLRIDPSLLTTDLRWEAPARDPAARYPHIYGPLNLGAVIEVIEFPCREDGGFDLPPGILNEDSSV